MKKSILIINFAFLFLIIVGDIVYILSSALIVKGLTSALFAVLGLINLIFIAKNSKNEGKVNKFALFLVIGLFFAMLGDILLNINFITGAILFAIAHIFYFVSYCMISKFKPTDLIPWAIIFIPSVLIITLVPIFDFDGAVLEIVCVIYALIISLMVGKACANFKREKSILTTLIFVGSLLFFFSDFMLLLNVFGSVGLFADILCLLSYYPAEFILAHAILYLDKFRPNDLKDKEKLKKEENYDKK